MPDFRAYAPHATPDAAEITLGADESHHLVVVNRCRRGDPVVAFDGRGREWRCECLDPAKNEARLRVHATLQAAPLPHAITLAQSLPKGATMDEIVRQATELGVARIIPLLTERTQVHLEGDRAEKKIEKWRTTAIEAAKQCGNPWVPEIAPVQKLEALLKWASPSAAAAEASAPDTHPPFASAHTAAASDSDEQLRASDANNPQPANAHEAFDLKLVASLHPGTRTLREVLDHYRTHYPRPPRTALWLVGPEGDFSPGEMATITAVGCAPVTLGPLVLRCDTAAVAALSVLSYELSTA